MLEGKIYKPDKRGREKVKYLRELVKKPLYKSQIKEKFIKRFKCHHSVFYMWFSYVTTGQFDGKRLNQNFRNKQHLSNRRYINSGECYFCAANKILHDAHLIYEPEKELLAVMCSKCHKKYDHLQQRIKERLTDSEKTEKVI